MNGYSFDYMNGYDLIPRLRGIAEQYKALQAQLRAFSSDDPEVTTLRERASQELEAGQFAQVETLLRQAQALDKQAIEKQKASISKRKLSAAAISADLGALKNVQLAYAEAAAHYREAMSILPQEEILIKTGYLNEEGLMWLAAGQYATAQPCLENALALREKLLEPEHLDVASSLNNLAGLYRDQGHYRKAESLYVRALALREKLLGPEHPDVAISLNNLAELYQAQEYYKKAELLYKRALTIGVKRLGENHFIVDAIRQNYIELLRSAKRDAEALQLSARRQATPSTGANENSGLRIIRKPRDC